MDKKKPKMKCPFCPYITSNFLNWKQHVQEKHGFNYTKWHKYITQLEEQFPITNWSKINNAT